MKVLTVATPLRTQMTGKKSDRVEFNRVKRKKMQRKPKSLKEQQTLEKAAHIVGLGPFTNELRRHHNNEHRDVKKSYYCSNT